MSNRNLKLILLDAMAASVALYISFLIRFDFQIPTSFLDTFISWVPWFVFIQISVFYIADLYARMWRYTSLFDLYAILSSVSVVTFLSVIYVFLAFGTDGYQVCFNSYYIINVIATVSLRRA